MITLQRRQSYAVVNPPLAAGLARFFHHGGIQKAHRPPFQRQAPNSRRCLSTVADKAAAANSRPVVIDSIKSHLKHRRFPPISLAPPSPAATTHTQHAATTYVTNCLRS